MAEFEKFTSGFNVGGVNIGIQAAKITTATSGVLTAWPAVIDATTSGSVPTVSAVASEINSKIGTVYKVKGTLTATVVEGAITNMPTTAENGDVWNIALPEGVTSATLDGQTITNGDNVVYVITGEGETATGAWDKLAGAVDTTTFATKEWVNSTATSGSLPAQYIANAFTTSAAMTADGAAASALVSNAGIKDYVSGYIFDNTLDTAEAISGIDSTTSGKLVNAGAISGYIKDQIDSTIQETIDIAEILTSGMTGTDIKPASAIPNASAVTGYIDTNTIKSSAAMTATDANANGLVSNSAIMEYVSAQLASTNAYGGIIVNSASASASKPGDYFKMVSGDGVSLETITDDDGNPTIKFTSNIAVTGVAGGTSASAALTVTSTAVDGQVKYDITVPDATTAAVGVVKADYYNETDGLIYLF